VSAIDAALIKEQGVTFAVVTVQRGVINNPQRRDAARRSFASVFGRVPIVLMEQDGSGTPTYQGRRDLVNFLSNRYLEQLPWKRYTVN
jgi:hypothetical protein